MVVKAEAALTVVINRVNHHVGGVSRKKRVAHHFTKAMIADRPASCCQRPATKDGSGVWVDVVDQAGQSRLRLADAKLGHMLVF